MYIYVCPCFALLYCTDLRTVNTIIASLIAERLNARLLIVQCGQFAFVCMYIYIRHTLIAWERFLWSRPHTTSHVVLV